VVAPLHIAFVPNWCIQKKLTYPKALEHILVAPLSFRSDTNAMLLDLFADDKEIQQYLQTHESQLNIIKPLIKTLLMDALHNTHDRDLALRVFEFLLS
jgi:hypothetical protein